LHLHDDGGVNRVVTKGTRYAVHQFADPGATDSKTAYYTPEMMVGYQSLLSDLYVYTKNMGVDDAVVTIASRTPPETTTDLSRQQIVDYKVDNVPTDAPEGQELAAVTIPNAASQTTLEELKLDIPDAAPTQLEPLAHILSKAMSRRIVMAETLDPAGMDASLLNTYAINVEYNGRIWPAGDVLAEKRRIVSEWGVRKRAIDDATWKVSCTENNITCTVSGDYIYDFGLEEGGFVTTNRWHFEHEIILPMALPRISKETVTLVK
jgi:hypothetical protein